MQQYHNTNFNYYNFLFKIIPLLFACEYLFCGFLLFGLKNKLKETSVLIQMISFTLLRLGKPEAESISCVILGIWLEYVAYQGKSFWPMFIIHLFINFTIAFFISYY
ncbi:MAG: CPBP family glutamic-type intramembrane protease [Candidatus Pacebacteria bacterium]|nr:CPBP family glutamic-type intramembrane protease [Candidatus Paceibacterota bacterium]